MNMEKQNTNIKSSNLILMPIVIIALALSSKAQAVSPAPDGGYPGGNTAEGQNALFSLTSGTYNTAVGRCRCRWQRPIRSLDSRLYGIGFMVGLDAGMSANGTAKA